MRMSCDGYVPYTQGKFPVHPWQIQFWSLQDVLQTDRYNDPKDDLDQELSPGSHSTLITSFTP